MSDDYYLDSAAYLDKNHKRLPNGADKSKAVFKEYLEEQNGERVKVLEEIPPPGPNPFADI